MIKRPNRAVLNDALDEYRDAMRPFIVRAMRRIKRASVEDAIYDTLSTKQAIYFERRLEKNGGNIESTIDIGDFPHLISRNWGRVFSQQFNGDMNILNLLHYIARARNKVAHPDTEDLDAAYTGVVLYHIVEVLGEINAPDPRAKVEGLRNKFLQPEESNPLILDLPDDTKAERSIYKESSSKPKQITRQGRKTETRLRVTVRDLPEKYNAYFQALLDELREQYNFTKARRPKKKSNYYSFASGFTGITYGARFPNTGTVYTQLKIDFGKRKKTTKKFFDFLKERESEINTRFDASLYWDRRDDIGASRIYIERDGNIESNASDLEVIRTWHVENLLKFKEVFTPEIQLALEKLRSSEIEPE